MFISASNFIDRTDATAAGRHYGDIYALVVLVILAFLVYNDWVTLSPEQTMFVGAAVIVGFRTGAEFLLGMSWDHYEHHRTKLMRAGVDSQTAFETVRAADNSALVDSSSAPSE